MVCSRPAPTPPISMLRTRVSRNSSHGDGLGTPPPTTLKLGGRGGMLKSGNLFRSGLSDCSKYHHATRSCFLFSPRSSAGLLIISSAVHELIHYTDTPLGYQGSAGAAACAAGAIAGGPTAAGRGSGCGSRACSAASISWEPGSSATRASTSAGEKDAIMGDASPPYPHTEEQCPLEPQGGALCWLMCACACAVHAMC